MQYLKILLNDGTELILDEWEEYREDDNGEIVSYWGSICGKCIEKHGGKENFGHYLSDDSTACCSVCGCNTPSCWDSGDEDDGMMYIDLAPDEVEFIGKV